MTDLQEAIAKVHEATGYMDPDADRAVASHEGWHYGERVRVVEDDEPEGVFSGDEGYVIIMEVGAPQFGNVRTSFNILVDDTDCPMEVSPYNIESA